MFVKTNTIMLTCADLRSNNCMLVKTHNLLYSLRTYFILGIRRSYWSNTMVRMGGRRFRESRCS